jgi:hypothetical protein
LINGADQVVLENYDDQDYGYPRIVTNAMQLGSNTSRNPTGPTPKLQMIL